MERMERWTGIAQRLLGLDDYGPACGLGEGLDRLSAPPDGFPLRLP